MFFLILAKPFISHISGFLQAVLGLNIGYNLFLIFGGERIKRCQKLTIITVLLTIIFGLYLRANLAYFSIGNNDINAYRLMIDLVSEGKNIYRETHRYNYSPLWFLTPVSYTHLTLPTN